MEGRYVETGPPWGYRAEETALLPIGRTLLDIGTGGELLSSLAPLPPGTRATEPPDVPVAAARLAPLRVRVVLDERAAFSPGSFADIGAVVMYLRITPWRIDRFDVAAYRERLLALHRRMQVGRGLRKEVFVV